MRRKKRLPGNVIVRTLLQMAETQTRICLVTPVWNDASRLRGYGDILATALAGAGLPIRWVIADDGSSEDERKQLATLRDSYATVYPQVELHLADAHRGKGAVVREAWAQYPDDDFLAFVDADGSASPEAVFRLVREAMEKNTTALGVRKRTANTKGVETPWRGLAHHMFLHAVHIILGLRAEDPQCGLKVIKGADYRAIESRLVEIGLAFDSELLTALHTNGAKWIEIPVNWHEKGGGKVRPARDAWPMLAALFRIRKRLRTGEFQATAAD